ncbi:hypothetical protein H1R20_g15354, partial [Candolleomyces eurysporus]
MAATEIANQSEVTASLSSRITRVDQRLDPRRGVTLYRKTGRKTDTKKQAERFEQNKPILFVRRQLGPGHHVIAINIDIRSKKLADVLKEMYDEIEPHGLGIARKPPSCSNRLFFLSREEFSTRRMRENAKEGNADKELIHDLDVALKYIEEDYTPTIKELEALLWKVPASITFDLLWTLFCPGSLLYAYDEYTEQELILKTRSFRLRTRSNTPGDNGPYAAQNTSQYAAIEAFAVTDDGKTFGFCTVERHIQQFDAGELGISGPDSGEANLKRVLELAQRWKAVVLLDEADVFLARRNNLNVARNALVSIFLRNLEYYQGILILTTNLITQCDPAFESRIHFTICYPSLSMELRLKIWKNFISHTSGKDTITPRDIKALAKVPMNGRQIRNSISVAQSFAAGEQQPLSTSHINMVMKMGRDWETAKATCGTPPSYVPLYLTTHFAIATILGFSVGLAVAVALAVMFQHRLQ